MRENSNESATARPGDVGPGRCAALRRCQRTL